MSLCLSSWLPLTVKDTQLKHNIIPTYSLQKPNNNARIIQHVQCAVITQISDNHATDQSRRSANYQPSIWSYDFLQSLQIRYAVSDYLDYYWILFPCMYKYTRQAFFAFLNMNSM